MATAQTEKGTRGNGPIAISFVDSKGAAHKRVPTDVMGITVIDKTSGKSKNFSLDDLPEAVLRGLAGVGLGKRIETYGRNTVKNNPGTSVISCAEAMIADLKNGQMYRRGEGNGKTKVDNFDYGFWVDVMKLASSKKNIQLSQNQIDKFVASLKALPLKARKQDVKQRQSDYQVAWAFAKVTEQRAAQTAKKGDGNGYDAFADL